jgi:NitT/TauT family transport system ATP-binding protein/nitrate/nitrite transport system substrate-binding protein
LLRLSDAAPLIIAKELGTFADEGLDVRLSVEPSWANVADKIAYDLVQGAVILPPLVFAVTLGLRGAPAKPLVVPMSISLNGNTITLAHELAEPVLNGGGQPNALTTAQRFAALLAERRRRGAEKPRVGVVHAFSTHNLLLRYWLAAGGVDPDRDITLTVIPPSQTTEAVGAGRISGFCAGAPWGEAAARAGVGRAVATSHSIWNNAPEKVFAVSRDWAEAYPEALQALLRALLRAARYSDAPENAPCIASLLSRKAYVGVDADTIRASLPGAAPGAGAAWNADVSTFFANAATFPWRSHALWFLRELARWGYIGAGADRTALAWSIYRPDLYRAAAAAIGVPVPLNDTKIEGRNAVPWTLDARPSAIPMGPDRFCDGALFDPAAIATTPQTSPYAAEPGR